MSGTWREEGHVFLVSSDFPLHDHVSGGWVALGPMPAWLQRGGRPPPSWAPSPVPTAPSAGPAPRGNAFQQLSPWAAAGRVARWPAQAGFPLSCFVLSSVRTTLSSKPKDHSRGIPLCMAEQKCPLVPGAASRDRPAPRWSPTAAAGLRAPGSGCAGAGLR